MHPGPMNRGVEIDPRVADAGGRADRDPGARRPRRADGGALRPAHDRPGAGRDRPSRWRWPDALRQERVATDDLVVRGARVLDPVEGIDAVCDVRVDNGTIAAARREPRRERPPRGRRRRASCSRRPSSTRTCTCACRARGRGDDRLGHRRRRGGRLLRDPRDAEHRPGRRLGRGARLADRGREGRGRDPGRLPRRDHPRPGGRGADRDGRARRAGRGRLHRRRPPGRRARR